MSPVNSLRCWHKSTSLLMAIGMTASAVSSALMALPASAARFTDIQTNWAQACIDNLSQRNVISGYPDGSFRPDAPVTRAEFAAMVGRAFPNASKDRSASQFSDVSTDSWAYQPIQTAARTGFLSGYPGNTFKPNQNIPRVQVLVALASGLDYNPTGSVSSVLANSFDDADQIPSYANSGVAAATEKRLVVNYPDVRQLSPNQLASRADVSAFLCQAVSKGSTASVPAQYIAGLPAKTTQTSRGLAAGTEILVNYTAAKRVIVSSEESIPLTLTVSEDVMDASDNVVIPAGSQIVGKLEPSNGGSQFVAEALEIGDRSLPIQATSDVITRTKSTKDPSLLAIARNSVLGAGAAAGISGLVGNKTITAQKVIPGAALGAAIETNKGRKKTSIIRDTLLGAAAAAGVSGIVGDRTITAEKVISGGAFGAAIGGVVDRPAKQVVIIEPATDLTLTLNSRFARK
jgi:S-layer homology domain